MKKTPSATLRLRSGQALLLLMILLLTACTATPPIPAPPGMKLVWHDEFDGKAINKANWN